jgi:hypothetical protein
MDDVQQVQLSMRAVEIVACVLVLRPSRVTCCRLCGLQTARTEDACRKDKNLSYPAPTGVPW